ncbi:retrovirus-related pol polyprotein from transposon TNT 1-94 [Tanacetum coccineum]|uniref:Retrovirus-related pol polyprotein from transposon TNT 1-94 n=1 Tax=Tanacetum coccineum TaxID=301880 RepID=A0ABQ5HCG0_9ASTR
MENSILNGPVKNPKITSPTLTRCHSSSTDCSTIVPHEGKVDYEFNDEENKLEMANTQAEIILSLGLPDTSINILNQTSTAQEIWNNVGTTYARIGKNSSNNGRKICLMSTNAFVPLETSPFMTTLTHATVHDGHIVTEPVQRKAPGNVGNTGARGKKVICYNCRGEGHVARQCKEPKRKMDSQYFKDKALLMEAKREGDALTTTNMFQANHEDAYDSDVDEGPNAAVAFMANLSSTSATNNPVNEVHSNDNQIFDNVDYQLSQEMHQEEHLDSDAETEIDDNTIPYHQYLLDTEAQNVPTEVSADTSDKVSMIAILTDLQTQLDGHAKVNQEKCLEIETLKNELLQCKQEICRLDTHKVKLDLENKVRQEQALVIQRNMRNAELVQENDLLKSTLSGKEKSIAFLQSEKEKIFSEKKDLADSYLDEIVCLKNANKVARDMLQRFNMPTQTIPMLSKKPKAATADLHKDLLGTRNPGLGYMAKRAQPALYDADTLLHPTHHPVSIWDSEEVLVHQVVSMKKMNEKPGHVRPANGFYEKLNALMFVPQQELSREQAYWLPANERASQTSNPNSPVTPFIHKSRPPSQVLASLQKVNAVFPQLEGIIKERTTQKPDYVSEWCYDYAKQFVEQQLVPFYDHFKKHIHAANDTFFKEVREFEQIFDELEAEYEQCVLDNKNLTIEKKNLLIKNDCLIAECLEKDISLLEHVSLQRRYDELSKANTHSRTAYTEKLSAFPAENTKLKAQVTGTTSSGPSTSETPKVLAPGMYNLGSKYIPPPKRANWVKPTPLPKKKQVSFSEPPRPSHKPTQKPVVHPKKQTNVCVPMSTGVKPTSGASKTVPKRAPRNPILCRVKSANARRVEHTIGTLNKKNLRFGNDEYAAIVGYGDYKLGDTIISRVYYVEGLKHNLFSVGQFCDGGLEVAFRQHSCHIRNYDMVDLLKGSRTTNLYSISLNDMMSASPVCLLTKASSTKSWLWHRRLNHLNFGTLNELARNDLVRGLPMLKYDKDHLCPSCQLGKSKKASHPLKTLTSVQDQFQASLLNKYFCTKQYKLELDCAVTVRRSRSALVKDPEPPSVPPTKKQNANGSPSTTVISEGAPAVTESLLPHQIPLPDTSDSDVETLFDQVDSNVFDTYNAPEAGSEASSSNSVNIDVTPNNQLPHVQKWTQAHPLENIIGDKDRPVSTRKQLETDAMWCFFNEFLTHVEPKTYKQALEHSVGRNEAMQEEISWIRHFSMKLSIDFEESFCSVAEIRSNQYSSCSRSEYEHGHLPDGRENRLPQRRTE